MASAAIPPATAGGNDEVCEFLATDCSDWKAAEQFVLAHQPTVRTAMLLCSRDQQGVERGVLAMLEAGVLDGFLADLRATHTAFTALVGLIECADDRVMDTLERLQAAQAAA